MLIYIETRGENMNTLKAIQSKAAIAAFIGHAAMWNEAMQQLKSLYNQKAN